MMRLSGTDSSGISAHPSSRSTTSMKFAWKQCVCLKEMRVSSPLSWWTMGRDVRSSSRTPWQDLRMAGTKWSTAAGSAMWRNSRRASIAESTERLSASKGSVTEMKRSGTPLVATTAERAA